MISRPAGEDFDLRIRSRESFGFTIFGRLKSASITLSKKAFSFDLLL